jgi:predicted HicB family RNase H-like nuclease
MASIKQDDSVNRCNTMQDMQKIKEETIRMNINISKIFHKQIKQKALDEDITVTELVSKAIKAYISDKKVVVGNR